MDMIWWKRKASTYAQEDVISTMPDIVITNILDRLSIQDAVRTGILARDWRFKWTLLSQPVFDIKFFNYLVKRKEGNNYGIIISRLLLHLEGAITKFVLYIGDESWYSKHGADISHWIWFLSRKGIKDLTLEKRNGTPLKLPTHLFSCLELKHMKLHNCCFHPPPTFHGFPNLSSLELVQVHFESGKFREFFTHCHVLEILNIGFFTGKVKLAEIAKLTNLKKLSLFLCYIDDTVNISSSRIFELVSCLPKLEELDLNFDDCKLTEDVAEKRFPTTCPGLKTLELSTIDLGNGIELSYAFQMIRSFPNLQTLKISSFNLDDDPTPEICALEVDYNTMGLLHLQSVVFRGLTGLENEVWLIKYLLACSPSLKDIVISLLEPDEKLKFGSKLLNLHRASPLVDIIFC